MITTIHWVLLGALVVSATWTVMTARLLRSAVGLAITSAILTILMFQLASPLAAVFELSVCAGLISAIFISTISLTQRVTAERPGRTPEGTPAPVLAFAFDPLGRRRGLDQHSFRSGRQTARTSGGK